MVVAGINNCEKVKADYFLPYAGYSTPYVKNFEYKDDLFHPTYKNIVKLLPKKNKKLLDIFYWRHSRLK